MARETEFYRVILQSLNERFPDHDMLNYKEVMQVTNMSINSVKKYLSFNECKKIHKTKLASWMERDRKRG